MNTDARMNLSDRLDALKEPSEQLDNYGMRNKCGCTWDSGPSTFYCSKHDPDALIRDALRELCEASEAIISMGLPRSQFQERFEDATAAVRRMIDEGVEPAT